MLRIDLHISNPWAKNDFKNLYSKSALLSKNKAFEFEIIRHSDDLFCFHFSTEVTGVDHAGPRLEFGLLGYSIYFKIYDTRHWNYDKNNWESHNE